MDRPEDRNATRITALACGHWLKRGDEEIPEGAACGECGEPVKPLVTWPLDADGNRVLWTVSGRG